MKSTALVLTGLLVLGLACAGGESTTAPPPVAPPPVAPAPIAAPTPMTTPTPATPKDPALAVPVPPPAEKTFEEVAFYCCDHERAGWVLHEYLQVGEKLADDNGTRINGEITALAGTARAAITKGGFGAEQNAVLERVETNAKAMLTKDLEGKREGYKQVSADLIPFMRAHAGGSTKVAEVWCPMAEAGWLQGSATVSNPYYGSKMLTCGSFR